MSTEGFEDYFIFESDDSLGESTPPQLPEAPATVPSSSHEMTPPTIVPPPLPTPNHNGGGGTRPGDWACPNDACRNHNFSFRTECNKCGAAKAHEPPAGITQQQILPPVILANATKTVEHRPGDWICGGCTNNNFAYRTECKKCGQPKKVPNKKNQETRPGDWECAKIGCNNMNFSFRSECKLCGSPKPESAAGVISPSKQARPGDWLCEDRYCGALNFSQRLVCIRCRVPKPKGLKHSHGNVGGGGGGSGSANDGVAKKRSANDWQCHGCHKVNFAYRDVCKFCKTAKTGDGMRQMSTKSKPHKPY